MALQPELMPEPGERPGAPEPQLPEAGEVGAVQPAVVAPAGLRWPAWSAWDVLAVLAITIFVIFVFSVAALFIARSLPQYRDVPLADLATNAALVVGAEAAAYPFVLLFIVVLVRKRARQPFGNAIHWNWPGVSATSFVAMGIVLALVTEGFSRFLPIPKTLPMDKYFHDAGSAYLMAAFGLTLAPLMEELFFRGLLYPLFRRSFGLVLAVILTAAAFAAIHGTQLGYAWGPILSIFIVGLAFTIARVRTNSVAASFLMHVGYNFALFGMLWLASDHYRHLEKVAG
jgi:CAAX protease family protein